MPENKINADGVISSFLDQIIAAKGEKLSKNERLSLRQELFAELDDKIDAAMIAALPDDKLLELNQKIDGDASEEDLDKFFADAGVDFNKVALQVALQFREDQLRGTAQTGAPVATETAVSAEPLHDMTQNTVQNNAAAAAPAGVPLQGTTSEVPGMSNVEGIARMVAKMSEGGENA